MKAYFNNRQKFEFAIYLIDKDLRNNLDIGYSDMAISFFDDSTAQSVVSDWSVAQIWDCKSFKGNADFELIE